MKKNYILYDLKIESDISISDLNTSESFEQPDIIINSSELSSEELYLLDEKSLVLNSESFYFAISNIATYHVTDKKYIEIKYHPSATEQEISLYLLGSCIGAVLFQNGYLPLHASSIYTEKGCVLFTGDSGAGKSTTLNAFIQKGYKMVTDDVSAMKVKDNNLEMYSSFPRAKIWKDTTEKLNIDSTQLKKIHRDMDKYSRPISDIDFHNETSKPYILYEINKYDKDDILIEEIFGLEKIKILINNTYRNYYLEKIGNRKEHFKQITMLEKLIKVKRIYRPENKNCISEFVDILEKDFMWV